MEGQDGNPLTRKNLWAFAETIDKENRTEWLAEYVSGIHHKKKLNDLSDEDRKKLNETVRNFLRRYTEKLKQARYNLQLFINKNSEWINEPLTLPSLKDKSDENNSSEGLKRVGRPQCEFDGLSEREKRRRTAPLRNTTTTTELTYAARISLHQAGNRAAAACLKAATSISCPNQSSHLPSAAPVLNAATQPCAPLPRKFTREEALVLFDQADLTKEQYIYIRKELVNHGVNVLPCYDYIGEEKKKCCPDSASVTVSESEASVKVQDLFDLTAQRFVSISAPIFDAVPEQNFVMIWKWGYDSASDYAQYQQNPENMESFTEGSILATSAVPLQILSAGEGKLIYQNDRPGSPRHCRPISFTYSKETKEVVLNVREKVQSEINELVPLKIVLNSSGKEITITHRAILSMIDGKIVSILSGVGPQSCNVCKSTPSRMNSIDELLARPVDPEQLQYFISVLHAWIRFLECALSIAYRLTIQHAYGKYTLEQKVEMSAQERKVKDQLQAGLGLKVDKVKSGGYGNTNDGNMARRFFENSQTTARLTGLNANLLERMRVILVVLSSCFVVNIDSFRAYLIETARLYVRCYPWYWMPASVHKVLLHSADIMKVAPVPLGLLSEEPLESCHKKMKHIRKHHTRLCSRKDGNADLLRGLLIHSDPVLYSLRPKPKRKPMTYCHQVLSLLSEPPVGGVLDSYFPWVDSSDEMDF